MFAVTEEMSFIVSFPRLKIPPPPSAMFPCTEDEPLMVSVAHKGSKEIPPPESAVFPLHRGRVAHDEGAAAQHGDAAAVPGQV